MRIILVEGQPGSGKSAFSDLIFDELGGTVGNNVLIDEYTQDAEIFGDFWGICDDNYEYAIEKFKAAWSNFLDQYCKPGTTYIMDNSLMNHIQYLMALSAPRDIIYDFARHIIFLLSNVKASMLLFDGKSETVISRIDGIRKNGWGERVAQLFSKFPYQKQRERTGKDGMIKFFRDSQKLKKEVLDFWIYPLLEIDITDWEWDLYREKVLSFIKE